MLPGETAPPAPTPPDDPCRDYWGPWKTLAAAFAILVACELILPQIVFAILLFLPHIVPAFVNRPSPLDPWVHTGGLISLIVPLKVLLSLALFWGAARLRRVPFTRFMAIRLPPLPAIHRWAVLTAVLVVVLDALRILDGRGITNEWVEDVLRNAPSMPLLIVAIVLAGPLYEELLFRGLLLPGLACSRLGPRAAVLLTSLAFSVLHLQYDWFDILQVLALGILLGIARLATGSTALPILLHMLVNAIALAEAALRLP